MFLCNIFRKYRYNSLTYFESVDVTGCYNDSTFQNYDRIHLEISSPGLCHEKCLERNISFFAIQVCCMKFIWIYLL